MPAGRSTPENQDNSSPSTSQVSVGSLPPNFVSGLLLNSSNNNRHYDLTPVTRNTDHNLDQYADEQGVTAATAATTAAVVDKDGYNVISPDDGVLHGEHLALPADLQESSVQQQQQPVSLSGPCIPKLRKAVRHKSVGTLDQSIIGQVPGMQPQSVVSSSHGHQQQHQQHSSLAAASAATTLGLHETHQAVQFPSRKFYSFTSRQQYEHALQQQRNAEHHGAGDVDGVDDPYLQEPNDAGGLEPYQPSRHQDWGGVGAIPDQALSDIFIARRRGTNGSSSGESHANHRLINPIPMDERQWSIPSIHLAHALQGSTTASYTENTEDDESLLFMRDDASLSSRGSSLYLPGECASGEPLGDATSSNTALPIGFPRLSVPVNAQQQQQQQASPILMNPQVMMDYATSSTIAQQQVNDGVADSSGDAVAVARRKRKQRKKEQRAVEWLQSVEAGNDVLAEAASSKFLTGSNRRPKQETDPNASFHALEPAEITVATTKTPTLAMLRRQASSPPTLAPSENVARTN